MKISNLVFLGSLFFQIIALRGNAQNSNLRGCGTHELYQQSLENLQRPGQAVFEQWLKKATDWESDKSVQDNNEIYYIPVVVHVLHFGEAIGSGRNLSLARIQSQIDILNNDYGRLPGTPGFNTNAAGTDSRIRFCLAAIGPNGESTSGVVRIQGTKPSYDFMADNGLIKSSIWDPNRYLNMWTCRIAGDQYIGYAQYPFLDSIPMPQPIPDVLPDGVVIDHRVFGDVPAGESGPFTAYNKGRTATHEVGHYLGLIHIWGDGFSCADGASDYCNDTPPQGTFTSGCPSSVNSCQTGVPAMFQNYMDYTNDVCMNVFTNDQKRRMRIVMRNAPRRKTLFTTPTQCGVSSISGKWLENEVKIYPNPSENEIWISTTDQKINRLFLKNVTGKVLPLSYQLEIDGFKVDASELSPGVYFLELEKVDGQRIMKKIIRK